MLFRDLPIGMAFYRDGGGTALVKISETQAAVLLDSRSGDNPEAEIHTIASDCEVGRAGLEMF